jgi:hypothetical protein
MKNILVISALVAASLLYSTTVFSAEKTTGMSDSYGQFKAYELNSHKDLCLIVAKNCIGETNTVMKRRERLNREIEKGAAVYTPEELQILRDELNWIYSESKEFSTIRM